MNEKFIGKEDLFNNAKMVFICDRSKTSKIDTLYK